jgi:hypothetical protein
LHTKIRRPSLRHRVTRLLVCLLSLAALAPAAAGQGGSINGAGAVVVGDTVYVNSGYSAFGPGTSLSGNVLLAFTLRGN